MRIDREVRSSLLEYSWPGNIRELENCIEFMVNMMDADGVLNRQLLPKSLLMAHKEDQTGADRLLTLRELEADAIDKALQIYGRTTEGKKMAARKLGIGLATLYRKIDAGNLSD